MAAGKIIRPSEEDIAIAVADRDAAVRESFSALLGGAGYQVATYETGRSLLDALPDLRADCLLVEAHLPDISAPQLLLDIHQAGRHLPSVLMADHALELPELTSIEPNPAALLFRPIKESCLFEAIEQALGLMGPHSGVR